MKLTQWPLMGGLIHLVQLGGDWAGTQPAQSPPSCIKYNGWLVFNGTIRTKRLYCAMQKFVKDSNFTWEVKIRCLSY